MELIINEWTEKDYQNYLNYLVSIHEIKYKDFSSKIITSKYEILGIRIPILRNIASSIFKGDYKSFLKLSKNKYYEEIMIEGFIISKIKNENEFDEYFDKFLDYIDNWGICDSFCASIKFVKGNKKYFKKFKELTNSNKEYYIRVGLISILYNFVNNEYIDDIFKILDNIKLNTYYVNMAMSWLLCECFIKQRDKTLIYIKNSKLNNFTFNKFISKCSDSYRISDSDKNYLKTLRKGK